MSPGRNSPYRGGTVRKLRVRIGRNPMPISGVASAPANSRDDRTNRAKLLDDIRDRGWVDLLQRVRSGSVDQEWDELRKAYKRRLRKCQK